MTTLNVAVVGYSARPFDKKEGKRLLDGLLDKVVADHPEVTEFVLVAGLTDLGIPALAYRAAKERGWWTVGVACSKATEYTCYPVDQRHIVGHNWGDESATFVKMGDVVVRVGGGDQALGEIEDFKAKGAKVYEEELAELKA